MRAQIKYISPNDYPDWEAFASSERPEPWDDYGWFSLDIGDDESSGGGTETFQVLVATPAAVRRAKANRGGFRGIIVDVFEPEAVEKALREHVSAITGRSWEEICDKLRRIMLWECEGM
jgi:hypothetical protein